MNNTVKEITIAKNVKIVNQSSDGLFYGKAMSIQMLHHFSNNTLAIIVPNENFYYNVKLRGKSRIIDSTKLLKLYAQYCEKFNVDNIFA